MVTPSRQSDGPGQPLALCKWLEYQVTDAQAQAVSKWLAARLTTTHRSHCPINLALEVIGDRWSLLIVRDLMFAGRHHYRELLQSEEGISSNILAERLGRLVEAELLSKTDDPTHKQKAIYKLTPMGIDLLPVIAALGSWGSKYLPVTKKGAAVALSLEKGGPSGLKRLRASLVESHVASLSPPTVRSKNTRKRGRW